ncbi:hypothetical protein B0T22DRAFT_462200 [Podospora appendiculata]|uniref:Uncharacterized protein n=1 Tax=Podospora appendiculata TaxID=314037 RepID=A0AAE1CDN2_9PEZI|nr:hypothetical protein B0T22DRAFT_462200 [Podospora appendiculata]
MSPAQDSREYYSSNSREAPASPTSSGRSSPVVSPSHRNDTSTHQSAGPSTQQQQVMSNYEFLEPWGGHHGFMRAYGHKTYDPAGYENARAQLDQMRERQGYHYGASPHVASRAPAPASQPHSVPPPRLIPTADSQLNITQRLTRLRFQPPAVTTPFLCLGVVKTPPGHRMAMDRQRLRFTETQGGDIND